MKVYIVRLESGKEKEELVFSNMSYLIAGLIRYIQSGDTNLSHRMLKHFQEYQERAGSCWEWLFTDRKGYAPREFEILLKEFNCQIVSHILDFQLDY
jgi:hypothetical protein